MVAFSPHIRFSQKFDLYTLAQHSQFLSQVRVDRAYKRKPQKIQLVDLCLSDRSKQDGSDT